MRCNIQISPAPSDGDGEKEYEFTDNLGKRPRLAARGIWTWRTKTNNCMVGERWQLRIVHIMRFQRTRTGCTPAGSWVPQEDGDAGYGGRWLDPARRRQLRIVHIMRFQRIRSGCTPAGSWVPQEDGDAGYG